jgi:hypothetical protein
VLLVAASSRVVVIENGGTPWWVPFLATLVVGLAAAMASYLATWWFKKRDIEGENARQAASLVDDPERALPGGETYTKGVPIDPLDDVNRLLREARLRAQPLNDRDLDQRLGVALYFLSDAQEWTTQPVGARPWMHRAIDNVRVRLAPYLAPRPSFRGSGLRSSSRSWRVKLCGWSSPRVSSVSIWLAMRPEEASSSLSNAVFGARREVTESQ